MRKSKVLEWTYGKEAASLLSALGEAVPSQTQTNGSEYTATLTVNGKTYAIASSYMCVLLFHV